MSRSPSTPPTVECYAGYRGEETPRRLTLAGRTIEVVEVIERRREPGRRGFRVRGDDGRTYGLRQDMKSGAWEVEAVER